jgi:hypothetical protein
MSEPISRAIADSFWPEKGISAQGPYLLSAFRMRAQSAYLVSFVGNAAHYGRQTAKAEVYLSREFKERADTDSSAGTRRIESASSRGTEGQRLRANSAVPAGSSEGMQ